MGQVKKSFAGPRIHHIICEFLFVRHPVAFETIEISQQGPIALLGLNRPDKLNAINAVMIKEINLALDQFESTDSVQAIVVHGNGRAFCSGFYLDKNVK